MKRLHIGNCLARYLAYRDTGSIYKWCTNYRYLDNPCYEEMSAIFQKFPTTSNPKFYCGFGPEEEYSEIIIPMSQFFVRDYYMIRGKVRAELQKQSSSWQLLDKGINEEYADYFRKYVYKVKSRCPMARITVLMKIVPSSKLFFRYGDYEDQLNSKTLDRRHFGWLLDDVSTALIDKAAVGQRLLESHGNIQVLYPWIMYSTRSRCFYRDILHYSETFVDAIDLAVKGSLVCENKDMTKAGSIQDFSTFPYDDPMRPLVGKINQWDELGIRVNQCSCTEQLETVIGEDVKQLLEHAESSFLGNHIVSESTPTLNISGFQSIASNICAKFCALNVPVHPILEDMLWYYQEKINCLNSTAPLRQYYTQYLRMVEDVEKGVAVPV